MKRCVGSMSDTINFGTARCGPNEAPIDPAQAFAERAARIEAVRSMLPKQGGIAGRGDDALALLRLQPQRSTSCPAHPLLH
jgi:hypothetical protein